jgi:hypothetical protein
VYRADVFAPLCDTLGVAYMNVLTFHGLEHELFGDAQLQWLDRNGRPTSLNEDDIEADLELAATSTRCRDNILPISVGQ